MSASLGDPGSLDEARSALRGATGHSDPAGLIDRLVDADPLWFLRRPPGKPEHLLLAVRCLTLVPREEARTLRAAAIAEAVVQLLEISGSLPHHPSDDQIPSWSQQLAVAVADLVLPVLARIGPDWAGRERYQSWFLTVGQYMYGDFSRSVGTSDLTITERADDWRISTGDRLWRGSPPLVAALLSFALMPRDNRTLALLRHRAVEGHRSEIREAAVRTIAAYWRDDPETLPWLRRYAGSGGARGLWNDMALTLAPSAALDLPGWAGHAAISLIAGAAQGDADRGSAVVHWLRNEMIDDPRPAVKETAIQWIVTLGAGDPRIMERLVQIAGQELPMNPEQAWADAADATAAAVRGLTAGWPGRSELLPLMIKLLEDSPLPVYLAAVQALAVGWAGRTEPENALRDLIQPIEETDYTTLMASVVGWNSLTLTALAVGWPEHPGILPLTLDVLRTEGANTLVNPAIRVLADRRPQDPEVRTWLYGIAEDEASPGGSTALQALARHWADHPDTLALMHRLAASGRGGSDVDVHALTVRHWPDQRKIDKATSDYLAEVSGHHCALAIRLIARYWPDHAETLPLLHRLAAGGHLPAIEVLGRIPTADAESRLLLHRTATSSGPYSVRETAAAALAGNWPDHPDTLPVVHAVAEQCLTGPGGTTIVRVLADGWPTAPGTLPLLQRIARTRRWFPRHELRPHQSVEPWPSKRQPSGPPAEPPVPRFASPGLMAHTDPDPREANPRGVAIHRLATRWADHPDTLPLLERLAATEPDHEERSLAVEALAAGWADRPETVALLRTSAMTDRYWCVRRSAARALAALRPDDETQHILAELAGRDDSIGLEMGQLLAQGWTDDHSIRPVLDSRLRAGVGWRGDPSDPGSLS